MQNLLETTSSSILLVMIKTTENICIHIHTHAHICLPIHKDASKLVEGKLLIH